MRNSLVVPQKLNRVLIGPRKFSLSFLLKRLENSCSHNNLLTKATAVVITVKASARSCGTDGDGELHPYRMSVSHEKPTTYTTVCMEKHYAKQKRRMQNIIYYMVQLL